MTVLALAVGVQANPSRGAKLALSPVTRPSEAPFDPAVIKVPVA